MNKKLQPCEECPSAMDIDVLYWHAAITSWHETGNKLPIIDGLRKQRPIPPFARNFIADVFEGKAKRKPILEKNRNITRNLFIKSGYDWLRSEFNKAKRDGKLLRGQSPRDLAVAELADMYGVSEQTIKDILSGRRL